MALWLNRNLAPPLIIVQGEDFYLDLWLVENVQVITLTVPTIGTTGSFTLSWRGGKTVSLDIAATAAQVQAALAAIPNVGAGSISVTGSAGGPWTVTALRTLALSLQLPIGVASTSFDHTDASVSVGYTAHDVSAYTASGKLADKPGTASPVTYASLTASVSADGQVDLSDGANGHVRVWIKAAKTATFAFDVDRAQLDVLGITGTSITEAWVSALVRLNKTVF